MTYEPSEHRDELIEVVTRLRAEALLDPWDEPTAEQTVDAILAYIAEASHQVGQHAVP